MLKYFAVHSYTQSYTMGVKKMETKSLPKKILEYATCHVCHGKLVEGTVLKENRQEPLFLCWDCWHLIGAVIHDHAAGIFQDISTVMASENTTWKEQLELWSVKDKEKLMPYHEPIEFKRKDENNNESS